LLAILLFRQIACLFHQINGLFRHRQLSS
jgi:hypothetical protein